MKNLFKRNDEDFIKRCENNEINAVHNRMHVLLESKQTWINREGNLIKLI